MTILDEFLTGVRGPDRLITDLDMSWWNLRFGPWELQPFDICWRLSLEIPDPKVFDLTTIDPVSDCACVQIQAFDGEGRFLFSERSIEFEAKQVHLNWLEIESRIQRRGLGTIMARNCYRLARLLGLERLGVTAVDAGAYAWAKCGFLPTEESWSEGNCRSDIATHVETVLDLSRQSRENVYTMLASDEPQTLWDIADLEEMVQSRFFPHTVPLGRALLAESAASWKGTLEFDQIDPVIADLQRDRVRNYLRLGDDE